MACDDELGLVGVFLQHVHELVQQGPDWLTFTVQNPNLSNPQLLRILIGHDLQISAFQEVTRSLEQVYLEVMQGENRD